jgi:hypothetical protein
MTVIDPFLAQWEKSTAHISRKARATIINKEVYISARIPLPQSRRRWKLLGSSHIYLDGYGSLPWAPSAKVGDNSEDREPVIV